MYGIKANVVIGDQTANFNKAIAEKDLGTGTIDVMIVGGQWVKTTTDLNLFFGPIKNIFPDSAVLAPSLWEVQEGVLQKGYLAPFHRNQTGILYDRTGSRILPRPGRNSWPGSMPIPRNSDSTIPPRAAPASLSCTPSSPRQRAALTSTRADNDVVPSKVANWNVAWKWFADRMDKLTITVSNNDSIIRMNGGEISMTVAWDDNVKDMMSKGNLFKRAKMYIPTMGAGRRRRHDGRSQERQEQSGCFALD